MKVTAETIRCVDRALDGEDYSNGALYFMNRKASGRKAGWFDSRLTYLFAHGGHDFLNSSAMGWTAISFFQIAARKGLSFRLLWVYTDTRQETDMKIQ